MQVLLLVVLVNYVAQVPYYIHQYYVPRGLLPSVYGSALLGLTLVWFLVAYFRLRAGTAFGYYLMLSFLIVQCLFYVQTQVSQYVSRHQIFLHVYQPHGVLLFVVFGIGYLEMFASAAFIYYLLTRRDSFLGASRGDRPMSG